MTTPNYGSTSLTVTITVADSACSSGGLSTGAIIGIAVGAGVGGLLLAGAAILFLCLTKKRRDRKINNELQREQEAEMRNQKLYD